MLEKIKKLKEIISLNTNENSSDEEINRTSEALNLVDELETKIKTNSEEIAKLKKEKVGFVKRLGVYSYDDTKSNDDEKSLDDIIKESAQQFENKNKK